MKKEPLTFIDNLINDYPALKDIATEVNNEVIISMHKDFIIRIDYSKVYINDKFCSIFDQDFEDYILHNLFEGKILLIEYKKKRLFSGFYKAKSIKTDKNKLLKKKNVFRILYPFLEHSQEDNIA